MFDEVKLADMKPDDAKKALDVKKTRSLSVRYENIVLPAGAPRAFSCNCESQKEFLPWSDQKWDRGGMERRMVFVLITQPLFSAGTQGAGAENFAAKRAEAKAKKAAREEALKKEQELRAAADEAAAKAEAAAEAARQAEEEVEAFGGGCPWGEDEDE